MSRGDQGIVDVIREEGVLAQYTGFTSSTFEGGLQKAFFAAWYRRLKIVGKKVETLYLVV